MPPSPPYVDPAAYHGPLAAAFEERTKVPEHSESEFDPEGEWHEPTCRGCGCTAESACEGGCTWVPDPAGKGDLCSRCLPGAATVELVQELLTWAVGTDPNFDRQRIRDLARWAGLEFPA